jgi:hypothetical protein
VDGNAWLEEALARYREQKSLADRALAQMADDAFFARLDGESNSVAAIVKHVAGNLRSRWTDFLTTDGEKADRARDAEFETGPGDSRAAVVERWENAWRTVDRAISSLRDGDLSRMVIIRGEPHTVVQAISRNLVHTAQHVGQIVLLAKHHAGPSWKTLSIPRGHSEEFNRRMRAERI